MRQHLFDSSGGKLRFRQESNRGTLRQHVTEVVRGVAGNQYDRCGVPVKLLGEVEATFLAQVDIDDRDVGSQFGTCCSASALIVIQQARSAVGGVVPTAAMRHVGW